MAESERARQHRLHRLRERAKERYAANPQKYRDKYKKWRLENPEKAYSSKRRQQIRDWAKANPHKRREYKFGLSQEAFDALLQAQNYLCVACSADLRTIQSKHVHVDHCHRSGQIRGILCHACNTTIGLMKENTNNIRALALYLERFK